MRPLWDGRSSRRELLTRALAGAGLLALGEGGLTAAWRGLEMVAAAEPPPETTTIKVARERTLVGTCTAPFYVVDKFLQSEGFTNVQYVEYEGLIPRYKGVAAGEADVSQGYSASLIVNIDKGDPIVLVAGGHLGCFELVATERVRSIRDLKGKTVSVTGLGLTEHVYLSILAAYVGLNPIKDINWVIYTRGESERLLREGKIDALMGFPPFIQGLRAKKIGHVVVNSMIDRPWSGYFCCMPFANRDFIRKHPVAAKRWLRAHLKTAEFLARQPAQAARTLVDRGYSSDYASVFQTLEHEVDYGKWRDFDPEDTVRFNALRLREVGMIKSSPQKVIAQGTDWRFLNEIKRELRSKGAVPRGSLHEHHGG